MSNKTLNHGRLRWMSEHSDAPNGYRFVAQFLPTIEESFLILEERVKELEKRLAFYDGKKPWER